MTSAQETTCREKDEKWANFLLSRLLSYVPESDGDEMLRNTFWDWWDQYSGFVIGTTLLGVGFVFIKWVHVSVVKQLGEALIIAGVLAIAIDPLVKGKSLRSATRDIFHHMLGFQLPLKIQDKLQEIVLGTKWYRENTIMHCTISEVGEFLRFDVEMEYEIVNPTQHTREFRAELQFEAGEQPTLKSVICFEKPKYGNGAKLIEDPKQPKSLVYKGKVIKISSQGRLRFKYEYSITYPIAIGYMYPNFVYPTIGLALTIKAPSDIVVWAPSAQSESAGEWRYTKLFMPGDHLEVRWWIRRVES